MILKPKQYPREPRERAIRMVTEHRGQYETEYAAIRSVAAKLGVETRGSVRK
jgi:transposase